MIMIWSWAHAPAMYKALSEHGGDEDGVILIPAGVPEPDWLERLWIMYAREPQRIETESGTVIIWAHA